MSILEPFAKELKTYCKQNSLDYSKAVTLPRCGNDKVLFIQRVDKAKVDGREKNDIPAEVLISAFMDENGKIQFEKGENAEKYLSI